MRSFRQNVLLLFALISFFGTPGMAARLMDIAEILNDLPIAIQKIQQAERQGVRGILQREKAIHALGKMVPLVSRNRILGLIKEVKTGQPWTEGLEILTAADPIRMSPNFILAIVAMSNKAKSLKQRIGSIVKLDKAREVYLKGVREHADLEETFASHNAKAEASLRKSLGLGKGAKSFSVWDNFGEDKDLISINLDDFHRELTRQVHEQLAENGTVPKPDSFVSLAYKSLESSILSSVAPSEKQRIKTAIKAWYGQHILSPATKLALVEGTRNLAIQRAKDALAKARDELIDAETKAKLKRRLITADPDRPSVSDQMI